MNWNNRIKAAKFGYILICLALCILGVILIAVPDFSALLLCRLGGVIMILFGLTLITEGVLNLITILTAVKIFRNRSPEIIDADYCEIK